MEATDRAEPERPDLSGCRVLLVEDEYFIADDLCCALKGRGAEVVGPVSSLSRVRPSPAVKT